MPEVKASSSLPSGVVATGNEVDPDSANPMSVIEATVKRAKKGYSPSKSVAPVVEHSPSRFPEGHAQHIGEMERGVEIQHGPAPGDVVNAW